MRSLPDSSEARKCPSSDDLRQFACFWKGHSGSSAVEIMQHAVDAASDGLRWSGFDPFAFEEDGLGPPEVDVSRSEIAQALVIAGMVVVLDEGRDLAFEIAGQVVMLKQDSVLERLMPALDLALGLRVIGGAADVFHFLLIQPLREILRDV
jgi:hypothetical protein